LFAAEDPLPVNLARSTVINLARAPPHEIATGKSTTVTPTLSWALNELIGPDGPGRAAP
jgi:hypothetical protein